MRINQRQKKSQRLKKSQRQRRNQRPRRRQRMRITRNWLKRRARASITTIISIIIMSIRRRIRKNLKNQYYRLRLISFKLKRKQMTRLKRVDHQRRKTYNWNHLLGTRVITNIITTASTITSPKLSNHKSLRMTMIFSELSKLKTLQS